MNRGMAVRTPPRVKTKLTMAHPKNGVALRNLLGPPIKASRALSPTKLCHCVIATVTRDNHSFIVYNGGFQMAVSHGRTKRGHQRPTFAESLLGMATSLEHSILPDHPF
jgi:hypothetical protein